MTNELYPAMTSVQYIQCIKCGGIIARMPVTRIHESAWTNLIQKELTGAMSKARTVGFGPNYSIQDHSEGCKCSLEVVLIDEKAEIFKECHQAINAISRFCCELVSGSNQVALDVSFKNAVQSSGILHSRYGKLIDLGILKIPLESL